MTRSSAPARTRRGAFVSPLLYLGIGLALLLTGTWQLTPPMPGAPAPVWWHLAALVGACAGILLQRRHVMAGFAVASAAALADLGVGLHLAVFLAWADTAYVLARSGGQTQRRLGIGLSGLAVLALWVVLVSQADGREYAVPVTLTLTAGVAIPFWWGAEVRNGDERAARADSAAHLERERFEAARRTAERERTEAVQRERTVMARELHDTVSAHLTGIALQAAAALSGPSDPVRDRGALRQTRAASLAALEDMRTMIGLLQRPGEPVDLQARGGAESLSGLVERHRVAGQDLTAVLEPVEVTPAAGQALYRVMQEGLVNAGKHGVGPVSVRLGTVSGEVLLEIENPMPPRHRRGQGLGLTSMAERLRAVGGTLDAGHDDDDDNNDNDDNNDGGRWRLHATIPTLLAEGGPA
ncbi:histidine kinase [Citricoccus sp. NPDC055426]|uniref:sensor histidine kinase n=1 Tax=Citricoccus sp. NPDC055426 TaxID=3155536 RepID=UPI00342CF308